jgi:RimJ/RimL family protein N-acetyltransferase
MSVSGNAYGFYGLAHPPDLPDVRLPAGYSLLIWRPSWKRVPPVSLRTPIHWLWWLFHILRVFRSPDFCVICLERDGRLAHRTTVFPPFFRFPFMAPHDLQIGDTWTAKQSRGRGLAGLGVRSAISLSRARNRRYWYVVHRTNYASIRVIEKEGFALVGWGRRCPRLGLRILGYYSITEPCDPSWVQQP